MRRGGWTPPCAPICEVEPGTHQRLYFRCEAEVCRQARALLTNPLAGRDFRDIVALGSVALDRLLLWTRGLRADPTAGLPYWAPPGDIFFEGGAAEGGYVTGAVGTDGSLQNGQLAARRRGGWAVVTAQEGGELGTAIWGPLPLSHPIHPGGRDLGGVHGAGPRWRGPGAGD